MCIFRGRPCSYDRARFLLSAIGESDRDGQFPIHLVRHAESVFCGKANNSEIVDGTRTFESRLVAFPIKYTKNWLFVGSLPAGQRASVLMSLIASCKDNRVEPWAYLRDLYTRLPLLGPNPSHTELEPFLPNHWLATHPQHRWTIADRRAEERIAKSTS